MTVNNCSEFHTEDDLRRVSNTLLVNDSADVCDITRTGVTTAPESNIKILYQEAECLLCAQFVD